MLFSEVAGIRLDADASSRFQFLVNLGDVQARKWHESYDFRKSHCFMFNNVRMRLSTSLVHIKLKNIFDLSASRWQHKIDQTSIDPRVPLPPITFPMHVKGCNLHVPVATFPKLLFLVQSNGKQTSLTHRDESRFRCSLTLLPFCDGFASSSPSSSAFCFDIHFLTLPLHCLLSAFDVPHRRLRMALLNFDMKCISKALVNSRHRYLNFNGQINCTETCRAF